MTDETSPAPPPTRRVGFLSLVTTDESVARGQVNLWAIVETVIAIGVFWWVTLTVETWTIFWSSLFVAPLLLLRSEASVKQGVEWFEKGFFGWTWPEDKDEKRGAEKRLERWVAVFAGLIGLALGAMIAHRLAITFLVGAEGWPAFWQGTAVGAISVAGAAAAAAAATMAVDGENAEAAGVATSVGAAAAAAAAAVAVAGAGAAAAAGAGAGALAGVATVAVAVAVAGAGAGAGAGALAGALTGVTLIVFVLPGLALGMLLFTVLIRFLATLRHPVAGLVALPSNIRRLTLFTAPGHAPDLLPGLPSAHDLRPGQMIEEFRRQLSSDDTFERSTGIAVALAIPVWFLPGWAYRFILKSTMWFWWIGLFLGGAPDVSEGTRGLKADHLLKWWHWASIVASAAGLAVTAAVTWGPAAIGNSLSATPILPVLAILVAFDFVHSPLLPTINVLNAALAIALVLWAQSIVVDGETAGRDIVRQMKAHAALGKIKKTIGALSIALIVVYAPFYINTQLKWLPVSPFVGKVLDGVYGKYAAALNPGIQ